MNETEIRIRQIDEIIEMYRIKVHDNLKDIDISPLETHWHNTVIHNLIDELIKLKEFFKRIEESGFTIVALRVLPDETFLRE